jgi:hypothetical protein
VIKLRAIHVLGTVGISCLLAAPAGVANADDGGATNAIPALAVAVASFQARGCSPSLRGPSRQAPRRAPSMNQAPLRRRQIAIAPWS